MLLPVSPDPSSEGFAALAESEPHACVWLAWPYRDWESYLEDARTELAAYARALAARGGEDVRLLVASDALRNDATRALGDARVTLVDGPYGDIWLRDTGPTFLRGPGGELGAACFAWSGWGGKYDYAEDVGVAKALSARAGARVFESAVAMEGGAVELDGAGTCITTRHCLLNENRNPKMSEADVSNALERALGVSRVLWLDRGLANDHTDSHVDNLARFVDEGTVVCMEPARGDPNEDVLREVRAALANMHGANGRRLEVVTIPSPGRVERSDDGTVMPASYANFFIANDAVFVPTYGVHADDRALAAIDRLFPSREAIGIDARAVLTGGGALHCITREVPTR